MRTAVLEWGLGCCLKSEEPLGFSASHCVLLTARPTASLGREPHRVHPGRTPSLWRPGPISILYPSWQRQEGTPKQIPTRSCVCWVLFCLVLMLSSIWEVLAWGWGGLQELSQILQTYFISSGTPLSLLPLSLCLCCSFCLFLHLLLLAKFSSSCQLLQEAS